MDTSESEEVYLKVKCTHHKSTEVEEATVNKCLQILIYHYPDLAVPFTYESFNYFQMFNF